MPDLVTIFKVEYSKAKQYQYYSLYAQAFIYLLIFFSTLSETTWLNSNITIITLLLYSLTFYLNFKSNSSKNKADKARKWDIYINILGIELDDISLKDFLESTESNSLKLKKYKDDEYYKTRITGKDSFVEILNQSMFWSKHLLRKTGYLYTIFAILAIGITIILFNIFIQDENAKKVSEVLLVGLSMLITSGFISSLIDSFSSSNEIRNLQINFKNINERVHEDSELLIVFEEYNTIISRSPLIPTWIYKLYRDKYNNLFDK